MCPSQEYQRKLHPDDLPLRAQQQRTQRGEQCHFIVRKNPHYPRRRQLLPPIIETKSSSQSTIVPLHDTSSLANVCERVDTSANNNNTTQMPNTDENGNNRRYVSVYTCEKPTTVCKMCRNNFRSCEFCQKNVARKLNCTRLARIPTAINLHETTTTDDNDIVMHNKKPNNFVSTTYSPVYNIREIRTVCNSFSALGIDKKLLDVECNTNQQSAITSVSAQNNNNNNIGSLSVSLAHSTPSTRHSIGDSTQSTANIVQEVVNNNPSKGYGSYVYI